MSTTTTSSSSSSSSSSQRTRLDRSLSILVKDPDETPSTRAGVAGATERLYRLYGATLIGQAAALLRQPQQQQQQQQQQHGSSDAGGAVAVWPLSMALTARVIFQRFYHCVSLTQVDVWAASMGALWVAAKTQEVALSAQQVIAVFQHLYRRRRLLVDSDAAELLAQHPQRVVAAADATRLSLEEKRQAPPLRPTTTLSSSSPVYQDWYKALVDAEGQILRRLGFMLYWIPHDHAHSYLLGFVQALGYSPSDDDDDDDEPCPTKSTPTDSAPTARSLVQHAWNSCQDASALDTGVRFASSVVAVAALQLAAVHTGVSWPADGVARLLGDDKQESVVTDCAHLLQGLAAEDTRLATVTFLQPLAADSFNGPGSFLWEMAEGSLSDASETTRVRQIT
jgi:hypothetical protein